ncbi:restriction endonuclease subunit S [Sorangium sp. So ce1504]|uniref:restriction endonuclease subunit S n=1 Tax=Sorangium sp. So ce1504 TaxID=3133337 RepID=UPI003F60E3C8
MSVQIPLFEKTSSKTSKVPARVAEMVGDGFDVRKFVENFEVLSEATGGVSALRRLVLELAVRGRFTSSRPAAHKDVEAPYPVPDDWCWSHGDDVFSFVTSGSRGWAKYYADEGPLFLRIGNLDYETTNLDLNSLQHVQPPTNAEGVRTRVEPGDILISITGDTGMVGLVPPNLGEAYINQHIALARPGPKVVPAFVARALTTPSLLGRLQGAQRGIKNSLGLEDVRRLRIPLPPLAEQRRIVAKVDQLMTLCDHLEARQAKKRETGTRLTKSALEALTSVEGPEEFDAAWKRVVENFDVLIDRAESAVELKSAIRNLAIRGALTNRKINEELGATQLERIEAERQRRVGAKEVRRMDSIPPVNSDEVPFPVPASWSWTRLGNLCWKVADGPHFSPKYVAKEGGVPFLSGRNVKVDGFELENMKYVSPEDHRTFCDRIKPEPGDILYTKGGTTGVALVNNLDFEFSVWVHVAVLKLYLANVFPQYVAMALNSPHCYAQSQKLTHGTGNRDLGLTRMVLITLPLPPLEEQKRIVTRVEQLMKVCDELEARLRRAENRAAKLVEAVVQELIA